jgi:hypothetical protein
VEIKANNMARLVKARVELWDAGMFPVMTGKDFAREEGACMPLAIVLPHEKQAQRNHGQTLHRLAERGGLSACELAAVLQDREWHSMPEHEAWSAIFSAALLARPEATSASLDDIEQYRLQMAGICTAAIGYWKEGDSIHPDYDTIALRDVAKLYAKYAALFEERQAAIEATLPRSPPLAREPK